MENAYLVKVDGDMNNNKFYQMVTNGQTLVCTYGRIGAEQPQKKSYSINEYNKIYEKKIKKGYVDTTPLKSLQTIEKKESLRPLKNKEWEDVLLSLQFLAKDYMNKNYLIETQAVTPAMIKEAYLHLNYLKSFQSRTYVTPKYDIYEFNEVLTQLFITIPRIMEKVKNYVATSTDDFLRITEREENLLLVLSSDVADFVKLDTNLVPTSKTQTILEQHGLTMKDVTKGDMLRIKRLLGSSEHLFSRAWAITNIETQNKFDAYLKLNKSPKVKLFWHGSRNENWWSIIRRGLTLNPGKVPITGKMFGYGLYLSEDCDKSLGYSSLSGSRWAGGKSDCTYMAIFATAYGNPHIVSEHDSSFFGMNIKSFNAKFPGCNCLHAKKGQSLRKDEIVVYDEAQLTIKYLVEFKK